MMLSMEPRYGIAMSVAHVQSPVFFNILSVGTLEFHRSTTQLLSSSGGKILTHCVPAFCIDGNTELPVLGHVSSCTVSSCIHHSTIGYD